MMPNRFCSGVNATDECGVRVSPGLSRRSIFASNFDGTPYGRREDRRAERPAPLGHVRRQVAAEILGARATGPKRCARGERSPAQRRRATQESAPRDAGRRRFRRRQDSPAACPFVRTSILLRRRSLADVVLRQSPRARASVLLHEREQVLAQRRSRIDPPAMCTQTVRHTSANTRSVTL